MTKPNENDILIIKEEPGGIISIDGKPLILLSPANIKLSDAGMLMGYIMDAVIDFYMDKAMSLVDDVTTDKPDRMN